MESRWFESTRRHAESVSYDLFLERLAEMALFFLTKAFNYKKREFIHDVRYADKVFVEQCNSLQLIHRDLKLDFNGE
jgi:hypothetical protein